MRGALPRLAAAAVSGVLWALAFSRWAPDPLGPWLSWIGLVPLFLALRRGAFGVGWVFGVVFWMVSIHWIAPTLVRFGGLPAPLAWLCLFLLASYLALFNGIWAAAAHRIMRLSTPLSTPTVLLLVPAVWILLELLQGWLFSGFPWNPAAQAWTDLHGALPLAAWVGTPGVSWLVVLIPACLAVAVRGLSLRLAAVPLLGVVVVLAAADRWAVNDAVGLRIRAALVQPNTELFTELEPEQVETQYRATLDLLSAACDPGNLVVVPESAAFPYAYSIHARLQTDIDRLADRGCTLILNSTRPVDDSNYNTALLVTASGVEDSYDKVHLVPWGEYVPLRSALPFMHHIARGASEFTAGDSIDGLEWAPGEIGVGICYDAIYARHSRALVDSGAELIVHITNDAWYGDTSAPRQLLRASRFRAAEGGRFVLRAALTGISAVIEPSGRVRDGIALGASGVATTEVGLLAHRTLYQRLPWLVPAMALTGLGFAIVTVRRRRHDGVRTAAD